MRIKTTKAFESSFSRLSDQEAKQTMKKLALLVDDINHPSLRVKKMKGKPGKAGIYRMRVNKYLRITFKIDNDTIILRQVGGHDETIEKA